MMLYGRIVIPSLSSRVGVCTCVQNVRTPCSLKERYVSLKEQLSKKSKGTEVDND